MQKYNKTSTDEGLNMTIAIKQIVPGPNDSVYGTNISGNAVATNITPLMMDGVVSPSAGEIPFFSSGTEFGNDSSLTWDNTNKRLGIGLTGISASNKLHVQSSEEVTVTFTRTTASTNNLNSSMFSKVTSTGDMVDGFGTGFVFAIQDNADVHNNIADLGAQRSGADDSGLIYFRTARSGTRTQVITFDTDGRIQLENSDSAAVSDPTNASFRVSSSGNMQLSNDGASYVDIATTDDVGVPAGSNGQVQFNSSSAFGADSNLFWDDTNKRLSIGFGTSPEARLHVDSTLGIASVKIEGANDPESQLIIMARFDENEGWGIFDNRDADPDPDDGGLTFTKDPGGSSETQILQLGALDLGSNITTILNSGGLQIGAPTGGDKGTGTINVATDIYKNNSAYNNPDYVFEHYFTGVINEYAKSEGASEYKGLQTLEDVRGFVEKNLHLPQIPKKEMGIFQRGDKALELIEELFLYTFELKDAIRHLQEQLNVS